MSAENDNTSAQPAQPTFPLLSLPDDVLSIICHFVALQRYSYSESRRPKPSALFHLSHAHSRLAQFATPLLHRRCSSKTRTANSDKHARYYTANVHPDLIFKPDATTVQLPLCHTLKMTWLETDVTPAEPDAPNCIKQTLHLLPNLRTLHLRHPFDSPPTAILAGYRNLRTLTAHLPDAGWLPVLTLLPHLTFASFSLKKNTPPMCAWAVPAFWTHIEQLELETAPHRPGSSVHPVQDLFAALKVPHNSTLQSLQVSVRLQLQHTPVKEDLAMLVDALRPFAHLALKQLVIDDYVKATPQTVSALAKLFPALETLAFGSRTVWEGSAEAHFDALTGFERLRELGCPRWPETTDPWRESEELITELARKIPKLELVALGGQQSSDEWFRVPLGRDEEGKPSRVDAVTLHCTDLDQ